MFLQLIHHAILLLFTTPAATDDLVRYREFLDAMMNQTGFSTLPQQTGGKVTSALIMERLYHRSVSQCLVEMGERDQAIAGRMQPLRESILYLGLLFVTQMSMAIPIPMKRSNEVG